MFALHCSILISLLDFTFSILSKIVLLESKACKTPRTMLELTLVTEWYIPNQTCFPVQSHCCVLFSLQRLGQAFTTDMLISINSLDEIIPYSRHLIPTPTLLRKTPASQYLVKIAMKSMAPSTRAQVGIIHTWFSAMWTIRVRTSIHSFWSTLLKNVLNNATISTRTTISITAQASYLLQNESTTPMTVISNHH